jgi:hypothetical protein
LAPSIASLGTAEFFHAFVKCICHRANPDLVPSALGRVRFDGRGISMFKGTTCEVFQRRKSCEFANGAIDDLICAIVHG